jgi:hypothetical protein
MVTAITAKPSHRADDEGVRSIPLFDGKLFGSWRGLSAVMIAMAKMSIAKVIAILFRNTM